ncbi:amino acid adenylation domain-containing protein [Mucilaginibacter sp. SJ]|uniref:amino acid adenylation domain-containing protein n=1 Tax=Mucilaginibacter sp. SJ TaxID=3029053 RepID=UPI0023A94ED9|nr:amino acid adenylation domain-containing protein [Mucilaginibacter sp. SJ]WEA01639.1 amino acid adenylation domain-containing protein [Mucilaginibacter sp. SJ]
MNSNSSPSNIIKDIYPLSPMQEGMLFHFLLGANDYFEQISYLLIGDLNINLIEKCFQTLVDRYDTFRTIFLHEGYEQPLQVVLKERKGAFTYMDIRDEAEKKGREITIEKYRLLDREQRFKLTEEVPLRVGVYRTGNEEYEFIWSFHHILMDGWCISIITGELTRIYQACVEGKEVILPPVQPYSNYISWLEQRDKGASLSYWREYLSGYENLATIPKNRKQLEQDDFVLGSEHLVLDDQITQSLKQIGRACGVTLNTILQTAWGILLSRYNNTNDVVFGSVVSGRPSELTGIENMVGLFINTVPVRISYEERDSVKDVLIRCQERAVEMEQHHYNPLSEVQSTSSLGAALLDHIMIYYNYPIAKETGGKKLYEITAFQVFQPTTYDLSIVITPGDQTLIQIDYNLHKYEKQLIARLIDHLLIVIKQIARDIDQSIAKLNILTEEEQDELAYNFNGSKLTYPRDKTIVDLFEEQVLNHPDKVAVVFKNESLSFNELNNKSNQLAHYLKSLGIVPGSVVGLLMDRSLDMIIGIMGVLKAGAGYMPVDPALPEQRVGYMLDKSRCSLLLTHHSYLERYSAYLPVKDIKSVDIYRNDTKNIRVSFESNDLAYCIFTSGSSGLPKGVMMGHRSVVNLVRGLEDKVYRHYKDSCLRVALLASYAFDASIQQIFGAVLLGHSLYICDEEDRKDGFCLIDFYNRNAIDISDGTPTHLRLLLPALNNRDDLKSLRIWILAGEMLPKEFAKEFCEKTECKIKLFNFYGPTETCVDSTSFEIIFDKLDDYATIPIGKPLPNERIYIADQFGNQQPVGITGELCIAGDGLAQCYVGDSALTFEKFVEGWISGEERVYRTGDLARWLADGNIEFLGRMDNQVKIRSYRIELGEIEGQLVSHPEIQEAVVLAREQGSEIYLVGYYVAGEKVSSTTLRAYLAERLPEYMLPTYFVRMSSMPLTTNGKTDHKKLPEPEFETAGDDYAAPGNGTERILVKIWSEVLKLDSGAISVNANFFELGGHSIRAIQLINKIQGAFSVKIDLRKVLEKNTISNLALLIKQAKPNVDNLIPKIERREYYLTSPAQERMYYGYLLNTNSTGRNISSAIEVGQNIQLKELESAFQALVERHSSLRTYFELTNDGVVQKILPNVKFELDSLNIGHNETLNSCFESFIKPFDLSKAPLIRGTVVAGLHKKYLFIDIHHIVCDGVSVNILTRDLRDIYFGKSLPELQLEYVDFAAWVRNGIVNEEKHRNYWSERLTGNLKNLNLPVLRDREAVQNSTVSEVMFWIENDVYKSIKSISTDADVTYFMFFLSVLYVTLNKITGDHDIIIGTDSIGRNSKQLEEIVGTFVNVLPLRMDISGNDSYSIFLQEVKDCVLNAFEHQEYPYDRIIAMVDSDRKQLIDIHFSFANVFDSNQELNDLQFNTIDIADGLVAEYEPTNLIESRKAEYDIEIVACEKEGKFQLLFLYNNSLYDADTIRIFTDTYKCILKTVIGNGKIEIDQIDIEPAMTL